MAYLPDTPRPDTPTTGSSPNPQPLSRSNLRQHNKAVAVSPRTRKALEPVSPEWTFLCQDKNYPRARQSLVRPVQSADAVSPPSVHWRGDEQALFMLDPAAKDNIRDYLLEQCTALKQTTNELKKPTGTKIVFILQFDEEGGEQEALCVPTNAATLYGIYNLRDAHLPREKFTPRAESTDSMQDEATCMLTRSRGASSFTRLMSSASEEGFPLADRELDSDSDDEDEHGVLPQAYTAKLDSITERDENEETDDGFVDVVDLETPKYCRDPDSARHPECHGRYKTESYAHNIFDAELDFQDRFVTAQNGSDNASYYRNWRTLKLDYGEVLVHGQSSLRNAVAISEEGEELTEPDDTEDLLDLIAEKYGPLTLEGQRTRSARAETECSVERSSKVRKYLEQVPENDLWLRDQSFADRDDELASEPSIVFDGVADFSDDEIHAPAPATAGSRSRDVPVMSEDALEELLNTPHEDFVNGYVQRYETMRKNAARAKQARDDAASSIDNAAAVNGASATDLGPMSLSIVECPELVITAATPTPSPTEKTTTWYGPIITDPETVVLSSIGVPLAIEEPIAPSVLPCLVNYKAVPIEISERPESASSTTSFRTESSPPASVFSRQASLTTKPSSESFWSDSLRLIDTLDLQVDLKPTTAIVSHHERSVSMRVLSLSASDTDSASNNVSDLTRNVHAQSINAVPSTPVRENPIAKKSLTPIIEVQTPLSSSQMPSTTTYSSTFMDDPYEGIFPEPVRYEQRNFRIPSPVPRMSHSGPAQPVPASVFTDDSSTTTRQERSRKLAAIKYRAQAVAGATKRATRRLLRSVKEMRAATRYLVPMACRKRNPYETFARP